MKRQKSSRMRGSHTHGWGHKKKHRGAGSRGGRGNAGSGKRGDGNKPHFWGDKNYFGKKGFTIKGIIHDVKSVNVSYFEEHIQKLISNGSAKEEAGTYVIDAAKAGFNRILGAGKITKKFKISAQSATKQAIEKVKKTGGEIILK